MHAQKHLHILLLFAGWMSLKSVTLASNQRERAENKNGVLKRILLLASYFQLVLASNWRVERLLQFWSTGDGKKMGLATTQTNGCGFRLWNGALSDLRLRTVQTATMRTSLLRLTVPGLEREVLGTDPGCAISGFARRRRIWMANWVRSRLWLPASKDARSFQANTEEMVGQIPSEVVVEHR